MPSTKDAELYEPQSLTEKSTPTLDFRFDLNPYGTLMQSRTANETVHLFMNSSGIPDCEKILIKKLPVIESFSLRDKMALNSRKATNTPTDLSQKSRFRKIVLNDKKDQSTSDHLIENSS